MRPLQWNFGCVACVDGGRKQLIQQLSCVHSAAKSAQIVEKLKTLEHEINLHRRNAAGMSAVRPTLSKSVARILTELVMPSYFTEEFSWVSRLDGICTPPYHRIWFSALLGCLLLRAIFPDVCALFAAVCHNCLHTLHSSHLAFVMHTSFLFSCLC